MIKHPTFAVNVQYSLKDHLFYIGYTANFIRRMSEHENDISKSKVYFLIKNTSEV